MSLIEDNSINKKCKAKEVILANVREFLDKTDEELIVMNYHSCLTLSPLSKASIMRNFVFFTPVVQAGIKVSRVKNDPNYSEDDAVSPDKNDGDTTDILIEMPMKKRGRKRKIDTPPADDTDTEPKRRDCKPKLEEIDIKKEKEEMQTETFKVLEATHESKRTRKKEEQKEKLKIAGHTLTPEQEAMLKTQVNLSKIKNSRFRCSQCEKRLACHASIRYHILSKHILPRDTNKEWVARKILESRKNFRSQDGVLRTIWRCTECFKEFSSAPAIRYHLTMHLR